MEQVSGVAGGVPYVALPPRVRPRVRRWWWPGTCATRWQRDRDGGRAAAEGLPAWRAYLGLPLSGSVLVWIHAQQHHDPWSPSPVPSPVGDLGPAGMPQLGRCHAPDLSGSGAARRVCSP
jgi:hypothetical protein